MTEGEVCLDYAKAAETQRQTQLGHASAAKNPLYKRKRDSWFQDEARLAIIGAEIRSHLGNVGLENSILVATKGNRSDTQEAFFG